MIVRGRGQYLDPQLIKGTLRFAQVRGSNFSALQPANKFPLTASAPAGTNTLQLSSRPSWYQIGCLIRVGVTENFGELHIIQDLLSPTSLDTVDPLAYSYDVEDAPVGTFTSTIDYIPYVTLLGTPANFFAVAATESLQRRILYIESWYPLVPGDVILASNNPTARYSLAEYALSRTTLVGTRPGVGFEPPTVYRYECVVGSGSGLLSFVPKTGMPLFLKAQPMFQRSGYSTGDIKIDPSIGPCLVDVFSGGLLHEHDTTTVLGLKTYDIFGNQLNYVEQEWQQILANQLIIQRNITSETFLLWQRVQGHFQLLKTGGGVFQAQLDSNGEFVMSSDLLVPPWSSATQNGWVVPILAEADVRMTIQFEPQALQVYDIPHSVLTLIRPKIVADPNKAPITKIVIAIKGSPNSYVQMRQWSYDGPIVNSLSYYILGTGAAFGLDRWLAGGFCLKPLFYDLNVLKANYSDGISGYDSGYIYF